LNVIFVPATLHILDHETGLTDLSISDHADLDDNTILGGLTGLSLSNLRGLRLRETRTLGPTREAGARSRGMKLRLLVQRGRRIETSGGLGILGIVLRSGVVEVGRPGVIVSLGVAVVAVVDGGAADGTFCHRFFDINTDGSRLLDSRFLGLFGLFGLPGLRLLRHRGPLIDRKLLWLRDSRSLRHRLLQRIHHVDLVLDQDELSRVWILYDATHLC
jgi:hypothetical protein